MYGRLFAAERNRTVNKQKIGILMFAIAAAFTVVGDTYQYIISGYPAANASYASSSSGTALVTSTRTAPTAAAPLEARYRTWDESDGIALRSDRFVGTVIIFR